MWRQRMNPLCVSVCVYASVCVCFFNHYSFKHSRHTENICQVTEVTLELGEHVQRFRDMFCYEGDTYKIL